MNNLPSVSYTSLEKAGLPQPLKSQMRAWIDRSISAGGHTPESARSIVKLHAVAAVEGVRATGEAAVFGSLLGAAHAFLPSGLDMKIPNTKHALPLDGAGAVLGLLASTFAAQEPYGLGKTILQGGAACATVFAFRKTNDLIVEMQIRKSGVTPGGGAVTPGKIGKANFNGEGSTGGWAEGSRSWRASMLQGNSGVSSIAQAALGL